MSSSENHGIGLTPAYTHPPLPPHYSKHVLILAFGIFQQKISISVKKSDGPVNQWPLPYYISMLSSFTHKLCLNETLKYGVYGLLNEMKAHIYPFVFLFLHLDFSLTLFCLKVDRAPFGIFLKSFFWFWSNFPWTCDKEKKCCTGVAASCWRPPCGFWMP